MFARNSIPRWTRLILLAILCVCLTGSVEAARLHAVLVVDDTDPGIGPWVSMDGTMLSSLLIGNVVKRDLAIVHVSGDSLGADQVLETIQGLRTTRDDTVLVYYSGHGAYDARRGHYFAMRGGKEILDRSQVVEAIRSKQARLGVLISDCCYSYYEAPRIEAAPAVMEPRVTSRLFNMLFFQVAGFVDMTSSERGQVSMVHREPAEGSLFTAALCKHMENHANQSGSWRQLFEQVKRDASRKFQRLYPAGVRQQNDQTAHAFALDTRPLVVQPSPNEEEQPPGNEGSRFGVYAVNNNGHGVRVTGIMQGYPGERVIDVATGQVFQLERGDVIIEVNGARITNTQDWWATVKQSPRRMRFKVLDSRTDRTVDMQTELRY